MTLTDISKILLDDEGSDDQRRQALDQFALMCSEISNLEPDPSYSAWSDDTFLREGVAINPNAAAYCIKDYQRSVVFIRGVFAALQTLKGRVESGLQIKVLYAGCGPFATLLLPLLPLLDPGELDIHLLDIHQQSLDSVARLLKALGLEDHNITLVQGDACQYQHNDSLDLIIVETMQKALEQEPQVSITAHLAEQLDMKGIFIPEEIAIELCLAHLEDEADHYKKHGEVNNEELLREGKRHPISKLMQLSPSCIRTMMTQVRSCPVQDCPAIPLGRITIPEIQNLDTYQPLLFTRILVFGEHALADYASSLTLPSRCFDLEPMAAGDVYSASYLLGGYPKIHWQKAEDGASL